MQHGPSIMRQLLGLGAQLSPVLSSNVPSPVSHLLRISSQRFGLRGCAQSRTTHSDSPRVSVCPQAQRTNISVTQSIWISKQRNSLGSCENRATGKHSLRPCLSHGRRSYATTAESRFGELTEEEYKRSQHRYKAVSSKEIGEIFGPALSSKQGNELLNTVQKQRVTGTLDHEIRGPGVHIATIAAGLAWLRAKYPLDEDAGIMARIEREEKAQQSSEYIQRAEKIGLYKYEPQQGADPANPYGKTGLEEIQQIYKARNEVKEAKRKQLQKQAEARGEILGPMGITIRKETQVDKERRTESADWVKKYKERAKLSDMTAPPDTPTWRLLWPSTLFMVVSIVLLVFFAQNYVPPRKEARLFPDEPPASTTVYTIIAINSLMLLVWRIPMCWRFMNKHFLVISATPNYLSLLGSTFSHHGPGHLLANVVGLWLIGPSLHDEVGRGCFVALYLGGGIFGSWVSLVRFCVTRNLTMSTLGASGSVMCLLASYCWLHLGQNFTIPFIPEQWNLHIRAEWILFLVVISDLAGARRGSMRTDHWSHLGGFFFGVASAEIMKMRARARHRTAMARGMLKIKR